jgi:hypothetical protein
LPAKNTITPKIMITIGLRVSSQEYAELSMDAVGEVRA